MPQHPSTYDTKQVLQPSEDTKAKAWARLEYEAARRGQALPVIPDEPPPLEEVLKTMRDRAARFNVDKIKQSDFANMGGAPDEAD